MPYITTEVDVDVNLEDFDDDQITEEYEARGLGLTPGQNDKDGMIEAIREIYYLRRVGKPYEHELNKLICDTLGVVA